MPGKFLHRNRLGRRYGAFRSPPNAKENGFPSHMIIRSGDWPVRAFLNPGKSGLSLVDVLPPIKDQADKGMCTGEGSASHGEFLYRSQKSAKVVFAPEFTYALNRIKEGTFSQGDVGANVDTSLQVADPNYVDPATKFAGVGWCPVDVQGYKELDITTPPSPAQLTAAKQYPGGAYHSLGNIIANMKSCILSNYPFVIGISVYDSFEEDTTAASGLIPYPNVEVESIQGGHEELSGIGYDDTIHCPNSPNPGAILTQNSWSTQWGCKHPQTGVRGYDWTSYDYLMNSMFTSDCRMAHLGKAW
jgi:hypothetical protein